MNSLDPATRSKLTEDHPAWIDAIRKAKRNKFDYVLLTLDSFDDDPADVFNALLYARHHGVSVLFVPTESEAEQLLEKGNSVYYFPI